MSKYIHIFSDKDEYEQYIKSTGYTEPFLGHIGVESGTGMVFENLFFVDPVVEEICVNTWGNGSSVLSFSNLAKVTDIGGVFYDRTDIYNLDDFQYFEGVTGLTYASTKGCFGGCSNLLSIKFPKSLKSVNSYAFNGCNKLTELIFPEGFTTVNGYSLGGYSGLRYLEFPSTLTTIGRNNLCPAGINLSYNIVIRATTPPSLDETGCFQYYSGAFRKNTAAKIYVPYSSDHSVLQAYQNDTHWATIIGWGINIYELNSDGTIPVSTHQGGTN